MNHDEATVYFDALAESVSIRPPSTADLIGAGRTAHRRRTRTTLFGVIVAVVLVLGGGAVVRGVVGDDGEGERLSETVADLPLARDGKRLIGVGRVVVEVPGLWVAESNGCEDTLGSAIYVHEPGPLGDRTCGGVSSVFILSTESATGRALARYPLEARTVGGVDVRVGDSCLPTAACIYPYGRIVAVPSEDVVILVSAGTRHNDALLTEVERSLQLLPEGLTTVPHVDPGTMADDAEEVVEGAGLDAILDVPDFNLAVEGTNPSGGSVVRVGSPVELLMPPVSGYAPDLGSMRAEPTQAAPGDVVAPV